ncbi:MULTISPECIES: CoA ester lyase [Allobacillus]|uniref:CoA ester lyase n=1 Tax=Allobacillus salarius TaxID=1955272 RepID=A0A556PMM9_9BACI|nr:CoA ester lyase [Allobacillus salarius]TSJ65644.1 CoA ester lyase [Allobacillus salarius]
MLYRNLLFVPAEEKFLKKIKDINADGFVIDLEDSILNDSKSEALDLTTQFLSNNTNNSNIFVRLNKQTYVNEIAQLQKFNCRGYMIPKVENSNIINHVSSLIDKNQKIIALIETPLGVMNLQNISPDDKLAFIAFGAEDYVSLLNTEASQESLMYPKSKVAAYAHAYNLQALDSISLNYTDNEFLLKEASISKSFGFTGKLAIHPNQIQIINQVFTNINKEFYKKIIEEFEKTEKGVAVIDGKVYEKPHIERFKRIINNW